MATTTMAIVVTVPGAPGRRLERLRRLLEPEGGGRPPPHIPLVAPFEIEPSFLPLEQHCWQTGHDRAGFWVELGTPRVGDGGRLVYAEVVSGRAELLALREALLTGKYAPPRSDGSYHPRAVVARLERDADVALARRETEGMEPAGAFFLERFELMAQYPGGAWYERDFYTLDRAVTKA
jgi:hypothetical protein